MAAVGGGGEKRERGGGGGSPEPSGRPRRKVGPSEAAVGAARGKISSYVTGMNGKSHEAMTIDSDLTADDCMSAAQKTKLAEKVERARLAGDEEAEDADYMSCYARVQAPGLTSYGEYKGNMCSHAEMNALADFVGRGGRLSTVSDIKISSPPCKSCAFVLELLGLLGKVTTNEHIKKNFTGSWVWPEPLQNTALFVPDRWQKICKYFGVEDPQNVDQGKLLAEVVKAVQQNLKF